MQREEHIQTAALVHIEGARFIRDGAAAVLPCCTFMHADTAFSLQRALVSGERLMEKAIELSGGLLPYSSLTEYTAVIEARMRLAGVDLDTGLSQRQTAAERIRSVPPGTRADVFAGFAALSGEAVRVAEDFAATLDLLMSQLREGRAMCAVPVEALRFLFRLGADYAAACKKLLAGEETLLVRRAELFDEFARCLRHAVAAQGTEARDLGGDAMASLAASGRIPSVPAVLFDILLRYERLPVTAAEGKYRQTVGV